MTFQIVSSTTNRIGRKVRRCIIELSCQRQEVNIRSEQSPGHLYLLLLNVNKRNWCEMADYNNCILQSSLTRLIIGSWSSCICELFVKNLSTRDIVHGHLPKFNIQMWANRNDAVTRRVLIPPGCTIVCQVSCNKYAHREIIPIKISVGLKLAWQ